MNYGDGKYAVTKYSNTDAIISLRRVASVDEARAELEAEGFAFRLELEHHMVFHKPATAESAGLRATIHTVEGA